MGKTMRRKPRSRIAHFQQPFLIGVVSSAALVHGCGDVAPVSEQSRRAVSSDDDGAHTDFAESDADEGSSLTPDESGTGGGATDPVEATDPVDTVIPGLPTISNPPEPMGLESCPAVTPSAGESCAGYVTGLECSGPYCYEAEAPLVVCNLQGLWEALPIPTCNPPPVEYDCPAERPQPGVACTEAGAYCEYTGCEGGLDTAMCNYGQWVVEFAPTLICNPPGVPICPPTVPTDGSPCAFNEQYCSYGECGGPDATCFEHAWSVYEVSCNPPEVEPLAEPSMEPIDAGALLPATDAGVAEDRL
jgi:hypothetical protein